MKITLPDIMDLDYFIFCDEADESGKAERLQAERDRKIYGACKHQCNTEVELLMAWLARQREQFYKTSGKETGPFLPGKVFTSLYTTMVYIMMLSGSVTGMTAAFSFLAYHGIRPVNVAVFTLFFIVLQVIFAFFTLLFLIRNRRGGQNREKGSAGLIQPLLRILLFNQLPKVAAKMNHSGLPDRMPDLFAFIQKKKKEYHTSLFWSFFLLTTLFAISFSSGALGASLFKVLISDVAFGWQSTLVTTSSKVHQIVSFMALPWSWFMPDQLSYPGLEQIEGSRIILKEGIAVLATEHLSSWWPFLCLGLLFYGVLPRAVLLVTAVFKRHQAIFQFDFDRPRFQQVLARMTSPVFDSGIDNGEIASLSGSEITGAAVTTSEQHSRPHPSFGKEDAIRPHARVLYANRVYPEPVRNDVAQYIEMDLFHQVVEWTQIEFDFQTDQHLLQSGHSDTKMNVIILHEVWQPPIRGLLYYFEQVRNQLPDPVSMTILLTSDPQSGTLAVPDNDPDFKGWKNAIHCMGTSGIVIRRITTS